MSVTQSCEAEGNCPRAGTSREYWIAGLALASGAMLGAMAMYLYDPNRGKARRAKLQEQALGRAKHLTQDLTRKAEDALNRAKGIIARAGAVVACHEHDDDEVIAARVRSHIGRVTRHAHAVKSEVKNGAITLEGILPDKERGRVVAEVRGIPGVKAVDNRLACAVPL
jgi:osmotically-inducible protein OsmY